MNLDHVGVVVTDLEDAIALYTSVFGMRVTHRAGNEQLGIVAAFLEMGGAELELIAPTRSDSMVSKFLADRGPGLHHLAYAVPDIREALADAKSRGLELIDEEPRIGLHGVPIAFIHPKSVGGVLTELVEHG
ncbi:MAG TPA: methylmalonyl-CoA epimerase [Candidatus Dormibacteraeota bacterium]|nr:methylmalonyl-CoA epimerase [Candidatus Dormibacteraeota bacterium]